MPIFTVTVKRDYTVNEEATVTIEADTAEDAINQAKRAETSGELEIEWSEQDGAADPDSYEWTATAPDGSTATGRGTLDDARPDIAEFLRTVRE